MLVRRMIRTTCQNRYVFVITPLGDARQSLKNADKSELPATGIDSDKANRGESLQGRTQAPARSSPQVPIDPTAASATAPSSHAVEIAEVHLNTENGHQIIIGEAAVARLAALSLGEGIALCAYRLSPDLNVLVPIFTIPTDASVELRRPEIQPSRSVSPASTVESFRECDSCAETFPVDDFPSLTGCEHGSSTCTTCFTEWVAQQLKNVPWDRVECPSSDYKKLITHEEAKLHLSQEVFSR